jgi:hypothetical protein
LFYPDPTQLYCVLKKEREEKKKLNLGAMRQHTVHDLRPVFQVYHELLLLSRHLIYWISKQRLLYLLQQQQ